MPLVASTIRWDESTYRLIRGEARDANVTVAQFVREAAIVRALVRAADRDAPGIPRDFKVLALEVERLAAVRAKEKPR